MALSFSEERPKKARMEPPWKLKVLMVDGAPYGPYGSEARSVTNLSEVTNLPSLVP